MKAALNLIVVSLVTLVTVLVGVQMFAAENGEVVVISTRDLTGGEHHTSLWIVDSGGRQWLRCGSVESGWYKRLTQTPSLDLRRHGTHSAYTIEAVPAQLPEVNRLMHEKYGWADTYTGFFSPHDRAVPIRLDPTAPDA
ncbi:MAG: hypothetical protein ACREXT_12585 [Gammaproteobacteria bacterium]